MTTTHESLYKTPWIELMKRTSDENGEYIYIREPWLINGKAVSILPFRIVDGEVEVLLRCEMADVSVVGTIKGGCDVEGESVVDTAVRETIEESGYNVDAERMIPLGTVRTSKLNTTTMSLFAVDVTGLEKIEAVGDGTLNEANASCVWMSELDATHSLDPIVHTTILRAFYMSHGVSYR